MVWMTIATIPKTGKEVLVCNTRQGSILQLVSWNKVHSYWQTKGKPDLHFQWTHWCSIDSIPKDGDNAIFVEITDE